MLFKIRGNQTVDSAIESSLQEIIGRKKIALINLIKFYRGDFKGKVIPENLVDVCYFEKFTSMKLWSNQSQSVFGGCNFVTLTLRNSPL